MQTLGVSVLSLTAVIGNFEDPCICVCFCLEVAKYWSYAAMISGGWEWCSYPKTAFKIMTSGRLCKPHKLI